MEWAGDRILHVDLFSSGISGRSCCMESGARRDDFGWTVVDRVKSEAARLSYGMATWRRIVRGRDA